MRKDKIHEMIRKEMERCERRGDEEREDKE